MDDEGFVFVVNFFGEFCRDGVVGSRVFDDKVFVVFDVFEDGGFFNGLFVDVCLFFFVVGRVVYVFFGVGGFLLLFLVIGELFEEVGFDSGGLL